MRDESHENTEDSRRSKDQVLDERPELNAQNKKKPAKKNRAGKEGTPRRVHFEQDDTREELSQGSPEGGSFSTEGTYCDFANCV